MNEIPKKITGEPPKKIPHPLDGRKGLSLVERVQVAVTKALNPEMGARLEKATGMQNDVKKLADDGMERSLLDTDKPPTGSNALDQFGGKQKKKVVNPEEIAVGHKAYSKNYLKRQLGLIPPSPVAETEADEEARVATLPKETPAKKDPLTAEKKAVAEMRRALCESECHEFALPDVRPTVKLAAFLDGFLEGYGDDASLNLPAVLSGMQQEGLFKKLGMADVDAFVAKIAAPVLSLMHPSTMPWVHQGLNAQIKKKEPRKIIGPAPVTQTAPQPSATPVPPKA